MGPGPGFLLEATKRARPAVTVAQLSLKATFETQNLNAYQKNSPTCSAEPPRDGEAAGAGAFPTLRALLSVSPGPRGRPAPFPRSSGWPAPSFRSQCKCPGARENVVDPRESSVPSPASSGPQLGQPQPGPTPALAPRQRLSRVHTRVQTRPLASACPSLPYWTRSRVRSGQQSRLALSAGPLLGSAGAQAGGAADGSVGPHR